MGNTQSVRAKCAPPPSGKPWARLLRSKPWRCLSRIEAKNEPSSSSNSLAMQQILANCGDTAGADSATSLTSSAERVLVTASSSPYAEHTGGEAQGILADHLSSPYVVCLPGVEEAWRSGCGCLSEPVDFEGYKLYLYLCPNGKGKGRGTHASISVLLLDDDDDEGDDSQTNIIPLNSRLSISLLNQEEDSFHWSEDLNLLRQPCVPEEASGCVSEEEGREVGFGHDFEFLPHGWLECFPEANVAYLKNDTLFIRVDDIELHSHDAEAVMTSDSE